MKDKDQRQTQDERTRGQEAAEDVREEFTTYQESDPERASPGDAPARREAELQPGPAPEDQEPEPDRT
jgi:hypothetical protein